MLVSWNWLKEYVDLPMSPDEAALRLMMAGLNHESTSKVGDDVCIDLEVTSNRPDCLGHIGIAREVAVLFEQTLKIQEPRLRESATKCSQLTSVTIECPQLCSRYIARVIRGVKIKPSPKWLVDRLQTIGIAAINNVVDVSNYVMMEYGQPLHTFDFRKLRGGRITVREARPGEPFLAIDHKTYALEAGMCVIADAERPVALAGVMGGADTEVSESTVDVLIEAADFAQLAIRSAARKLKLHSASSYRFERGMDPLGVDWASRRCAELLLDLAGGELASGSVDVGNNERRREPIVLRLSQLQRILGIEIPAAEVQRIFTALGCEVTKSDATSITSIAPSWRRDLTREIDLIEEAARIHGYDKIPEDAAVPMTASHKSDWDRMMIAVRQVLNAAGFDEAMTPSVVTPEMSSQFSPWTDAEPLAANQPMLKGADRLRRSIVPSLLQSRHTNESLSNATIELFETARLFLAQPVGLPREQVTLAASTGGDYYHAKGVLETLLARLNPATRLEVKPIQLPLLEFGKTVELSVGGKKLGYLGVLSNEGRKAFKLRGATTVLEIDLETLHGLARFIPQYDPQSEYPSMARDLNLIVAEAIRWSDLERTVLDAAGEQLEQLRYLDTYRDAAKDGADRKRLLFSMTLRSRERTLTGEEVDRLRDRVVDACKEKHQAVLLG